MDNRIDPKLSESEKKLFVRLLQLVIDISESRNMEGNNDTNDLYYWFLTCREGRSSSVIMDGENMRQDNQEIDSLMLKLKEHMLLHKWQDAMKVLETLSKSPRCKSHYVLLKLGLEIIYRLKCGSQTFDNLADFVGKEANNSGMEEVLIDLFNFKLISRLPDGIQKENGGSAVLDDVSELMDVKIKTVKTKGQTPIEAASKILHDYYYPGIITYIKWNIHRLKLQTQESYEQDYADQLRKEAEKAVNNFSECEKYDGVWDIIVMKHVEILEYHSVADKNSSLIQMAEKVLKDYEESYPKNPNAPRMLYKFYKRNPKSFDGRLATKVLVKISKKLPSDVLVLELVSGDVEEVGFSRMELLFELLDHHVWKDATELWNRLARHLVDGLMDEQRKDDTMKTLRMCWEFRKEWWPEYHFQEWTGFASVELDLYRASVAVILLGKRCRFYRKIVKASKEQSVTSHAFELLNKARKLNAFLDTTNGTLFEIEKKEFKET